ncbi:unnamed protein product, partial [Discosporangium mesarthrocarpum]
MHSFAWFVFLCHPYCDMCREVAGPRVRAYKSSHEVGSGGIVITTNCDKGGSCGVHLGVLRLPRVGWHVPLFP